MARDAWTFLRCSRSRGDIEGKFPTQPGPLSCPKWRKCPQSADEGWLPSPSTFRAASGGVALRRGLQKLAGREEQVAACPTGRRSGYRHGAATSATDKDWLQATTTEAKRYFDALAAHHRQVSGRSRHQQVGWDSQFVPSSPSSKERHQQPVQRLASPGMCWGKVHPPPPLCPRLPFLKVSQGRYLSRR